MHAAASPAVLIMRAGSFVTCGQEARRHSASSEGGEEAFGLVRPLALKAIADAETFPKDEQLILFEKVYWMQSAIERKAGM